MIDQIIGGVLVLIIVLLNVYLYIGMLLLVTFRPPDEDRLREIIREELKNEGKK